MSLIGHRADRPLAVEILAGIRAQEQFKLPLMDETPAEMRSSSKERALAHDLVGQDLVGKMQPGKLEAPRAWELLGATAKATGLPRALLMQLHIALHAADAGAHEALRETLRKDDAGVLSPAATSWALNELWGRLKMRR